MLENKKLMPPPWIAFPEIGRYSIGWRMGYGEDYIHNWRSWLAALTEEEKIAYRDLFPEPITWKGYWEDKSEENYYRKNDFITEFWNEKGTPKYTTEKIRQEFSKGKNPEYTFFFKSQPSADGSITESCLSQWWKSDFLSSTHTYCCMEQYMMANKAELFNDEETCGQIMQCRDPKQIKALGRQVKNFNEKVWGKVKYSIVLNGNYLKFAQNAELRDYLLSTGDRILAEASPYDGIWGIGMGQEDENISDPLKWKGENLLGFALMEVRDELRRVWKNANMCEKVGN